jgi:predicted pyridoxine 5'-phosphate oxidase superfamily flavin-nucleotide-binding protein
VVTELDACTLAMPDWSGNNRIDSLRNIGDILKEMTLGEFDGTTYDIEWPKQAQTTMW